MKTLFLSLTRVALATVAGIGIVSVGLSQPTLAQMGQEYDNQPGYDVNDGNNPCAAASQNFNAFNLIHCARFNNGSWNAEEGLQGLDAAARAFRERQQKYYQNQQTQTNPNNSVGELMLITPIETNQSGK
ncbi:MAG: hypothetical protein QNJ47_19235 [Nostocaceae cyanobacterium]|nr:hypothetical protein [Nostocaceae cyanobacterium]